MFGIFGNKKKKLEKKYNLLLEQAMQAQRSGNIDLYSQLSSKADKILREIELIEQEK